MKHVVKAKSITKKIICLALIIMLLIDNLITPITIFAKERSIAMAENLPSSSEEESKIEYLEDEINLQNNEDITLKTKNDDHEIKIFKIEFVSGATKDENQNLVWTPSNSSKGHEFTFRVNYAISGLKELPAETLQIKIPKSIIRNRDGNLDDHYIMSLPTSEEYDGTTELAYKEDGDYVVVYNPDEVEAGLNGYFEVSYATNSSTFSYKDYDISNTDLVTNGGTASDPFNAIITVESGEDTLTDVSDDINLFINTNAKIVSTQKRYPNIYREWNSSWMAEILADSNEYYYLIWEISTNVSEPTQPYNFKIEDFVTDLTKGTQKEDYEFVGYKLSGEQYFSDKNEQENSTISGTRYDYVLTRHKISTYSGKKYTLKNTETATVDPIDQVDEDTTATSSNQFSWDPGFKPPTGHFELFKYGNNNWASRFGYHWDYASYDLEKLQNEEVNKLNGFKYFTETIGYAYPWTLEEGASSDEPKNYGKKSVKYDTWDDTLYLEDDTRHIDYKDYYLDYFTYQITNKDAVYDDFYNRLNETTAKYEENETIIFYGKFNGGTDWVQIGTYNLATKELVPNNEYVSQMTTSEIIFKEGVHCTGWRFTTENKHYYTYITVTPYFVLTNSDYVKEKIANKDSIKIKNNVSTNIKNYKDKTIFEKETSAFDYARVTYYDSGITKKVISVSNSVTKRLYTISWKVNAWETATSGSGKAEYIRQDSGIFYDLIPLGGEVDLNSIQVQNENGFLPENEYTYETIANYNNSGRTMLIVRIKEQAQYYTVFYNTIHSWESMADYGRNVLNPVAYETGNEKITKGYADNGGNLSTKNKDLYKDLDNTTDDKKFIYAEATNNINALTAAVSGLYKKVKNSTESVYSYETQTEPNSTYSYQMRYQNTYLNKSKNLILFDSLENFVITDSEAGTTKTSGWKGTLKSIDLTQIENMGIAPVLYISTKENLDLEENHDLTDTSTWTAVTDQTDLSTTKAIAIDMRKDTKGNDFVLDTGKGVTAVMYMQAPDNIIDESNPYTYNNIYINNTLIDDMGGTEDYFIHQDYTEVKYHIVADVEIVKVNEENEYEKIKGITFRLYGTSIYGTEVDKLVTSDKNGNVNFRKIEAGNYILQEYEGTKDWLEDHTEHRVEIKNTREVFIDGNLTTKDNLVKIKNKPRIHADVTFYKKDLADKNKSLEGVKFKLEGTSDYGNEVLLYGESSSAGKVTFEDLEKGTYTLLETSTIDGYILNGNTYKVLVDENGNSDIQKAVIKAGETKESYESIYDKGNYYIYNEPYHSFYFIKKDSYNYEKLGGAKFKLYGCSNIGNIYDETKESVEGTGYVTFENLESGTYVLKEIEAPNTDDVTYALDKASHIVEVFEDGKVTLDGKSIWPVSETNNEPYIWNNTRNKGQITVTKKWVDNKTNEEREEPVIYISTKKPEESYSKAYFRTASSSNSIIDYVTTSAEVKSFRRNTILSETQVREKSGVTRLDSDYDNEKTEYKIYGWVENETLYWWTKADSGVLPANLDYYFNNESSLKEIDWTGIYKTGYWKGTAGSEEITKSITNMQYMFYGCSSIESLNISWFNNTQIEISGNMEYAFGNNYSSTATGTMSSLKYITIGENFKLFNTSVLTKGSWKNQQTEEQKINTNLIGTIAPGTYEYMGIAVKYAVQIYGINQDEDESGQLLGLTFGPATGANYNNSYVTHTYEENSNGTYDVVIVTHNVSSNGSETESRTYLTNSSGDRVTRTAEEKSKYNINMHDMSWADIEAVTDKTVFTDCMLCGDTKSVQINLNSLLASGAVQTAYGDGAGILYNTLNSYYRKWNPSSYDNPAATQGGSYGSNAKEAGGYSSSHIRATLVGKNEDTKEEYAGDVNTTSSTSLYSCIESDLQNVITAKKVKYVTGSSTSSYNSNEIYDKIWLFSEIEVYGQGSYSGYGTEGIGTSGVGYDKFGNSSSKYYMPSYNTNSTANRRCYNEYGSTGSWWLRSPCLNYTLSARYVDVDGYVNYYHASSTYNGLALGFCIK